MIRSPRHRAVLWALASLLALVLLAFASLLSPNWSLKFDNTMAFMPYRHFFSVAWRDGLWPAWNPYINLGYAFPSDPQSGAWYPVFWLIALLQPYDLTSLKLEWLFHVWLAGAGMFFYVHKGLQTRVVPAMTAAAGYMLSGFFVGTAQLLVFIIPAAWLPWLLWRWRALSDAPSAGNALAFAVPMGLMVSGSYPAFPLLFGYFALGQTLIQSFSHRNHLRTLWTVWRWKAFAAVASVAMSIGFLVSFAEALPDQQRAASLEILTWEMDNPFGPRAWGTMVWPLLNYAGKNALHTDISLANGFFGLWAFLALIMFCRGLTRREIWGTLMGAGLLLVISSGVELPLMPWLRKVLPGWSHFRHAGLFRLFFILLLTAMAAVAQTRHQGPSRIRGMVWMGFAALSLCAWLGLMPDPREALGKLLLLMQGRPRHIYAQEGLLGWQASVALWSMGLFFVGLAAGILHWVRPRWRDELGLAFVIVLSLAAATTLHPLTVARPADCALTNAAIQGHAQGAPRPPENGFVAWERPSIPGMHTNMQMVAKQPSHMGYNPFKSNKFDLFSRTPAYDSLLGAPVIALLDTARCSLRLTRFDAEGVDATLDCITPLSTSDIVLRQMHHPDWSATVNGQSADVISDSHGLCSITSGLLAGENQVVFRFTGHGYRRALGLQASGWGFLFVLWVWDRKRKRRVEG